MNIVEEVYLIDFYSFKLQCLQFQLSFFTQVPQDFLSGLVTTFNFLAVQHLTGLLVNNWRKYQVGKIAQKIF